MAARVFEMVRSRRGSAQIEKKYASVVVINSHHDGIVRPSPHPCSRFEKKTVPSIQANATVIISLFE